MRAARQKCDILSSQHVGLGCAQSSLPNAPAGCCGVEVELGREMAKGVIRRVFCRCRVSNGLQESQWESTHSHSLLRVINTPGWITGRSLRAISSRTKYFRYRSGSWEVLRDTTKGKARSRAQRTKFFDQLGSGSATDTCRQRVVWRQYAQFTWGEPEVAGIDFWLYSVKFSANSRRVGGLGRSWLA